MNRFLTALLVGLFTLGPLLPGHAARADDGSAAPPDTTDTPVVADDETEVTDAESAPQDDGPSLSVDINGSLRFNVLFRSYGVNTSFEQAADRVLGDGGFTFDTFRIGASGSYGNVIFDAEYAFYPASFGGNYIHHGWAGYKFSEDRQIQVGVSQVPFGIQPYASSSWFFNTTYYVGLEDDYDAGIKAIFTPGNWELKGAYYMNAEQTDFFASSNAARYSYDVVPSSSAGYIQTRGVSEEHQFNAKVTYTFNQGESSFTTLGVSAQRGQLLNQNTGATDWHAAYALHLHSRLSGFEAKLEFAQQELNPPSVNDERFVVMGAYGSPNRVASEHSVYSSSLAYHIPVNVGPVSEIKPYYDFSMVTKNVDGWNDNVTHDVGFLTSAGPLFIYTDLNISKGHPFNQPFDGTFAGIMAQNADNTWRTAFNVNIGIYF